MSRARATAGPRVRVQESRYGRELIVDETFASFQRTDSEATGSVWDAIAAPLLALPTRRRRRVLVLGLGGGSVARIVRALAPDAEIVGVELDAEVVAAARRFFDLDALGVTVHVEDALAFLRRDRRLYDLILEDVFIGRGDDVYKPDWIPHPGHDLARARLRTGGILVTNTIDEAKAVERELVRGYRSVVRIGIEDYDNLVYLATEGAVTARDLRARVAACPVLGASLPVLRFRSVSSPGGRGRRGRGR